MTENFNSRHGMPKVKLNITGMSEPHWEINQLSHHAIIVAQNTLAPHFNLLHGSMVKTDIFPLIYTDYGVFLTDMSSHQSCD